ncbi:MAG: DUF1559 domain-containing protein [Planctomycetaceae bacterium]|nr:DUF1559 domain-containing protein [Planctomycetaceae bacterium]
MTQPSRIKQQCQQNLNKLALGLHRYHEKDEAIPPTYYYGYKGTFPPLYTVDEEGKPLHSWRVLILPYIGQQDLYDQIRLNEPWDSEHNKQFHNIKIPVFSCPANNLCLPGKDCTYSAIAGEGLIPATEAGITTGTKISNFTAGTSNTIAIIEVKEPFCWMNPTADITLDELAKGINEPGRVGSFHSGGCNAAFFDASIRFLPQTIDNVLLKDIGTRDTMLRTPRPCCGCQP